MPNLDLTTPLGVYVDIVNNMMSDIGYTYRENNNFVTVNKLSLQEAMDKLDQILDAQLPTEAQLKDRLNKFLGIKSPDGFASPSDLKTRFVAHPEEMTKRLEYSRQLRNAMKPYIKRNIQRQIEWDETCARVFGTDRDGNLRIKADAQRFGLQFMELGGTAEARHHNDRVIAVTALANEKITAAEFEKIRTKSWTERGYSKKEAKAIAHKELEEGAEFLVDCFNKKVRDVNVDEYQKAGATLLSGKASQQDMENAMKVLNDDGMYLMFTATAIFSAFLPALSEARSKELYAYGKKLEDVGSTMYSLSSLAQLATTPEYAYLDFGELADAKISFIVPEEGSESLKNYIDGVCMANVSLIQGKAHDLAAEYGFSPRTMDCYALDKTFVFKNNDAVLLLDVEALNVEKGYDIKFNANAPGRYVDRELRGDAKKLLEEYQNYNNDDAIGKDEYAKILEHLNGLKDDTLGDAADAEACRKLKNKLNQLNFAVAAYFDTIKEREEIADKKMSDFAKQVKEFADKNTKRVDCADKHRQTMERYHAAKETAEKYGFSDVEALDNEMYACKKDGELLLLNKVEGENGKITYSADSPGLYVDNAPTSVLTRLAKERSKVYENLSEKFKEPSPEIKKLTDAVNDVHSARLGKEAELDDRVDLADKIYRLKKIAESYIEAYQSGNPVLAEERGKAFADEAIAYANDMRERLSVVEFHTNTVQQRLSKAEWVAEDAEKMSLAIDLAKESQERLNDELLDGASINIETQNKIFNYILKRKIEDYSKDTKVKLGSENERHDTIEIHSEEAYDRRNKEIIAANVVQELLINEEHLYPNEDERKMLQTVAATGHIDTLVKMVWDSQSFTEKVRSMDLSSDDPDLYEDVLNTGLHKEVAKDIMKSYLNSVREAAKNQPKQNQNVNHNPNMNKNPEVNNNIQNQPKNGKGGMVAGGGH